MTTRNRVCFVTAFVLMMMGSGGSLAAATSSSSRQQRHRHLQLQAIAGYIPETQVTDHNAIDLDQQMIEVLLDGITNTSFKQAERVYDEGAHSKSFAILLLNVTPQATLEEGWTIIGNTTFDQTVSGTIMNPVDMGPTSAAVQVKYDTSEIQESYVNCQVGGSPTPNLDGCFKASGEVLVSRPADILMGDTMPTEKFTYTYDPQTRNQNDRTIRSFSITASERMKHPDDSTTKDPSSPYYPDFGAYANFYGVTQYADEWIMSAFEGRKTTLQGFNANFENYSFKARAEAIKLGTVVLSLLMNIIRELEEAVYQCPTDKEDALHSLDESVAFYTGSLEGQAGSTGSGKLMYSIADSLCGIFKTCGEDGDSIDGTAKVNLDIFKVFDKMQNEIRSGNCDAAAIDKEKIIALMHVPLIQGTIHSAYLQSTTTITDELDVRGATYAAAIIPLLMICDMEQYMMIGVQMELGNKDVSFQMIKGALEREYQCLQIHCTDIGGIWNPTTQTYDVDAEPCNDDIVTPSLDNDDDDDDNRRNGGGSGGRFFFILVLLSCLVFIFTYGRKQISGGGTPVLRTNDGGQAA